MLGKMSCPYKKSVVRKVQRSGADQCKKERTDQPAPSFLLGGVLVLNGVFFCWPLADGQLHRLRLHFFESDSLSALYSAEKQGG